MSASLLLWIFTFIALAAIGKLAYSLNKDGFEYAVNNTKTYVFLIFIAVTFSLTVIVSLLEINGLWFV